MSLRRRHAPHGHGPFCTAPSHRIFRLRQPSHARMTLRRLCRLYSSTKTYVFVPPTGGAVVCSIVAVPQAVRSGGEEAKSTGRRRGSGASSGDGEAKKGAGCAAMLTTDVARDDAVATNCAPCLMGPIAAARRGEVGEMLVGKASGSLMLGGCRSPNSHAECYAGNAPSHPGNVHLQCLTSSRPQVAKVVARSGVVCSNYRTERKTTRGSGRPPLTFGAQRWTIDETSTQRRKQTLLTPYRGRILSLQQRTGLAAA